MFHVKQRTALLTYVSRETLSRYGTISCPPGTRIASASAPLRGGRPGSFTARSDSWPRLLTPCVSEPRRRRPDRSLFRTRRGHRPPRDLDRGRGAPLPPVVVARSRPPSSFRPSAASGEIFPPECVGSGVGRFLRFSSLRPAPVEMTGVAVGFADFDDRSAAKARPTAPLLL